MNAQEFRQEIDIKKPRYLAKYFDLMQTISTKGTTGGGDYIKAISCIIRRIEGYANTGLNYIQNKFNNEKDEFRSPQVFLNLLREVADKEDL